MALRLYPILIVFAALCSAVSAQTPATAQEGGDFTFKRVGVPSPSTGNRINVQIDPDAEVYRITPGAAPRRPGEPRPDAATQLPPGVLPGPGAPSAYEWYWATVSPSVGIDAAQRFNQAMDVLQQNASKVGTPRLEQLQRIVQDHGVDILASTIGTNVSPALVLAVISVESAGEIDAESHAGAQGLMQLIPATAKRFGVSDSFDPRQNITGGVAYLDWLMTEFNRDPVLALAGYNAGEGAVEEYSGVPPFSETRAYVPKVLAAWNVARGLCLTRPVLISDGCVFIRQTASDG